MSARLTVPCPSLSQQTCAVCLEDFKVKDELGVLPCQHAFHRKWVQESTVGSFSALVTTLRPPARASWKWKCSCEISRWSGLYTGLLVPGCSGALQDVLFSSADIHSLSCFFCSGLGRGQVELVLRTCLLGVLKYGKPIPRCHLQREEHDRRS